MSHHSGRSPVPPKALRQESSTPALTTGQADVTTLTEACGASRPAVGPHLTRLRLAGLVKARKEGHRVIYSLPHGHLRRLVEEASRTASHE